MPHSFTKTLILSACLIATSGLGGCAQIGKAADGVWSGTKSVARFVASPFRGKDDLRGAPVSETYQFADQSVNVELYDTVENPYAGGVVELYDLRSTPASYAVLSDPRDAAFVSLNGQGRQMDWRNCEMLHRGYLYADEMSGLMLDPDFEVCMRNKGYVLETELRGYPVSGEIVRAPRPTRSYPQGYSYSYP